MANIVDRVSNSQPGEFSGRRSGNSGSRWNTCGKDTAEGAEVTFRVYDRKTREPVVEPDVTMNRNKAEWTYDYEYDHREPLKEKPEFYFTADMPGARQNKSSDTEIGQNLSIQHLYTWKKTDNPCRFEQGVFGMSTIYPVTGKGLWHDEIHKEGTAPVTHMFPGELIAYREKGELIVPDRTLSLVLPEDVLLFSVDLTHVEHFAFL